MWWKNVLNPVGSHIYTYSICRVSTIYPRGLYRTPAIVYIVSDTHIIIYGIYNDIISACILYTVNVMRFTAPNRIIYKLSFIRYVKL